MFYTRYYRHRLGKSKALKRMREAVTLISLAKEAFGIKRQALPLLQEKDVMAVLD